MNGLVRSGGEPGLLAYEGETAVGWLSLGPREDFGQLVRSRTYAPPEPETGVWAVVCFYVHPTDRHRGVNPALLEAAVDYARAHGASALEAYPHARGDFMGAPELFQRFGFEPLRTAGPRVVMRRTF
jgi:GNAT superfamily N-acetyltransferase